MFCEVDVRVLLLVLQAMLTLCSHLFAGFVGAFVGRYGLLDAGETLLGVANAASSCAESGVHVVQCL